MTQFLSLIVWILRLGPFGLGVIAVAILGAGYYLDKFDRQQQADRAAVLAAGPPPSVDISKFDRDQHTNEMREVVVQAQPLMENAYRLTLTKNSGDDYVFMVPLISAVGDVESDAFGIAAQLEKDAANQVFGIAYFTSENEDVSDITPEIMLAGLVGVGDTTAIIEYNGRLSGMGQWDDLTEEAFAEQGLTMPRNPVIVWPYLEGRNVAFAPRTYNPLTIFRFMSFIAGAFGLLAVAKLFFRKKTAVGVDIEPVAVEPALDAYVAPEKSDVPLWKQRSGLAGEPALKPEAPTHIAPTHAAATAETPSVQSATLSPSALNPPKRNRFGVRKVLIGIVGGLFALGLVGVLSDLIAKPSSVVAMPMVSISSQDLAAQTLADIVVPDADPNRHWTDIDVTPIYEWVVAQAMLAASGDVKGQMNIGMVIGGWFLAMFMVRWFFVTRVMLRKKSTFALIDFSEIYLCARIKS